MPDWLVGVLMMLLAYGGIDLLIRGAGWMVQRARARAEPKPVFDPFDEHQRAIAEAEARAQHDAREP